MAGVLTALAVILAGLYWLWIMRESRKPAWGRVRTPTFADVAGKVILATKQIQEAFVKMVPAAKRAAAALDGLRPYLISKDEARDALGIPIIESDLVPEGKMFLIDIEAARRPPEDPNPQA